MVADFKDLASPSRISPTKSLMVLTTFLAVVSKLFIISMKRFSVEQLKGFLPVI